MTKSLQIYYSGLSSRSRGNGGKLGEGFRDILLQVMRHQLRPVIAILLTPGTAKGLDVLEVLLFKSLVPI